MTSPRQQQANRQNARKSTGPKTESGKQRAARNALRHGLSVASLSDACWQPEVLAFARSLVPEDTSSVLKECALDFASAQIDVLRVKLVRAALLKTALADEHFMPARQRRILEQVMAAREDLPRGSYERLVASLSRRPEGDDRLALILSEMGRKLVGLERYHRRALSRRRRAMRAFDLAARKSPQVPERTVGPSENTEP